ncbi:MAG TPA: TetR/AcrR family transcriptional regulator [Acidimicrobiales bacterium]
MPERNLTSQGAERKQQLLDAAAALFADQGYSATRVVDIVDAAGVAKGLFYWYFENKEAVFRELAANIRQRLRRHQRAAMDPTAPALDRLVQGSVASVEFMAEHAHFFSLLEGEGRTVSDVLRQGYEQHLNDTIVLIEAGQADGTVTTDDPPDRLAHAVVGVVGQFSHSHRTKRIDLSLDELAAFVARLVARMLAVDEHAARAAVAALHRRRSDAKPDGGQASTSPSRSTPAAT